MTPEQHNKYVALAHVANAAFYLLGLAFMVIMLGLPAFAPDEDPNAPPLAFFAAFLFLGLIMTTAFSTAREQAATDYRVPPNWR